MKYLNSAIVFSLILFTACGSQKKEESTEETMEKPQEEVVAEEAPKAMAMAVISSASGSTVSGEASFIDNGDGTINFELSVKGASPGVHALHLHANGDCSAPDATSAGGHWNPAEVDHGARGNSPKFHAGDIDNMIVGVDSAGLIRMTVKGWTIGGPDSTNVIGKAIIIHGGADDFTSQPSGAAGPRVGCGVVTEKM